MGRKKEIYQDVWFFHQALQLFALKTITEIFQADASQELNITLPVASTQLLAL